MSTLRVSLADGTPAVLRPVIPEDRERIVVGMTQLSSESRYFRFFTPQPRLAEDQLRYFTEVDQRDHVAWVALNAASPTQTGLGIGRYVRCDHEPRTAEFALTVIDAYQRKGLGRLLLAILLARARGAGIARFQGVVLPENRMVIDWLVRLGARAEFRAGVYQISLPVGPSPPQELGSASLRRLEGLTEQVQAALTTADAVVELAR